MAPENLYGATKASCDMLLKMYAQNYGLGYYVFKAINRLRL